VQACRIAFGAGGPFSPSQDFPKAFARTVAVVAQRPSFCGHTTKAAFPAGIDMARVHRTISLQIFIWN
jgi:hypothetical protein